MPEPRETDQGRLISSFIDRELRSGKEPNRLIAEKSPYLPPARLQSRRLVPLGARSVREGKTREQNHLPLGGVFHVLLVHVMEREVFEDRRSRN